MCVEIYTKFKVDQKKCADWKDPKFFAYSNLIKTNFPAGVTKNWFLTGHTVETIDKLCFCYWD